MGNPAGGDIAGRQKSAQHHPPRGSRPCETDFRSCGTASAMAPSGARRLLAGACTASDLGLLGPGGGRRTDQSRHQGQAPGKIRRPRLPNKRPRPRNSIAVKPTGDQTLSLTAPATTSQSCFAAAFRRSEGAVAAPGLSHRCRQPRRAPDQANQTPGVKQRRQLPRPTISTAVKPNGRQTLASPTTPPPR
jgi:hypothetical protein